MLGASQHYSVLRNFVMNPNDSTGITVTPGWKSAQRVCAEQDILLFSQMTKPPLGRTRSRGRCWAAIRLFHRPEPLGHAVHGGSMDWTLKDKVVDGLFFCATLTGRSGSHTPFLQIWAATPDAGTEAVTSDPGSSWEGRCRCRGWKCGVLWGWQPTPHCIGDPPIAPHVCCYC